MVQKTKIYLDTSVISYLDQQDTPEQMEQTLQFWDILKSGKYSVVLGSNVFKELSSCEEEKAKMTVYT